MFYLEAFSTILDTHSTNFIEDGQLHRCGSRKAPRTQNGWYIIYLDNPSFASFGDWEDVSSWQTVFANNRRRLSDKDFKKMQERLNIIKEKRKELQRLAQKKAQNIYDKADNASEQHPYLMNKKIKPIGKIKQIGDSLIIPIFKDQQIISLQFIEPNGDKRFLKDGEVRGGYFYIKGTDDRLFLLCEGYATGVSLFLATGFNVLVAFNAGNLSAVGSLIKDKNVVVCADNDHYNEQNIGLIKGLQVSKDLGAGISVPDIINNKNTDFNDIWVAGIDIKEKYFF